MPSNHLMHYGVKGMKWGVRHDYVPTGYNTYGNSNTQERGRSFTQVGHTSSHSKNAIGKSVVLKWQSTAKKSSYPKANKVDKRKLLRNVLLGTAAVSAAAVVGLELYKYGHMSADTMLRKGTLAQSVAVAEKTDWSKSFYAATAADDRRKILKNFSGVLSKQAKEAGSSGEVYANIFTNKNNVRIAGRKALRKSYKSVYGTTKGFGKYIDKFNEFDQAKRQPMMDELARRGYGGFKDQAGMKKWWGGKTPIVLNGSSSGFELRNRAKINITRLSNMPVKDIGTKLRKVEEHGINVATDAAIGGIAVQSILSANKVIKKRGGENNGK